ncbi:MAG: hypothetical protein IKB98_07830 [Clostridia bacterium]|nr:hypothetical protein [Clostridia bacterium]
MKALKKTGKIALIILIVLASLFLLIFGGFNALKFAIYSDYYSIKENVCKNPGLSDGFVCQGICAVEEQDKILVSGYMKDHSASRIYVTDLDDNSYWVEISINGKKYSGHGSGIARKDNILYLASENQVHLISLSDVLNAKKGNVVNVYQTVDVTNEASFVYSDDNYLYVGEFHDGGKYVTTHPYQTPEGKNHAIVCRYSFDDLTKPNLVYSIRDKVQGVCFTPNGKMILSTSYGLKSSVYYVYNLSDAVDLETTLDGAPVFGFTKCVKEIKGPAMAEGLDYYKGKVITLTESASNKYIFGKFFFANKIVALDFN